MASLETSARASVQANGGLGPSSASTRSLPETTPFPSTSSFASSWNTSANAGAMPRFWIACRSAWSDATNCSRPQPTVPVQEDSARGGCRAVAQATVKSKTASRCIAPPKRGAAP